MQSTAIQHKNLAKSLLGRLRLRLFRKIVGDDERLPSLRETRQFITATFRKNSSVGQLFLKVLTLRAEDQIPLNELPENADVDNLMASIETRPLDQDIFVSLSGLPDPFSEPTGVQISREPLSPSGFV